MAHFLQQKRAREHRSYAEAQAALRRHIAPDAGHGADAGVYRRFGGSGGLAAPRAILPGERGRDEDVGPVAYPPRRSRHRSLRYQTPRP